VARRGANVGLVVAEEALLVVVADAAGAAQVACARAADGADAGAHTAAGDYGAGCLVVLLGGGATAELGDGVLDGVHELFERRAAPFLLLLL